MKISIAIPTWECNGRGVEFLDDLLRTISIQTFKDFQVVISDHSLDRKIQNFCEENIYDLPLRYFRCEEYRGNGPFNTNNAIELCEGEIIKIMFQDDFFYDDESLEKIVSEFNSDFDWLVCGCNHTFDDGYNFINEMYPKWNDNILNGVNTISSPSVVAFRKKVFDKVKFDINLKMMMDCEFYHNLKCNFGDPVYLNDILVTNRIHRDQISKNYDGSLVEEIEYCRQKHYA